MVLSLCSGSHCANNTRPWISASAAPVNAIPLHFQLRFKSSVRSPFPLNIVITSYMFVCFSHQVISNALWPPLSPPPGLYLPGSSVHRILQARILKWVAIPFSRGSSQLRDWTRISCTAGRFFSAQPDSLALSHLGSPTSYMNCPKPDCEFIISQKFSWFLVPTSRLLNKAAPSELSKEKSNRTSTVCRSSKDTL